MDPAAGSSGLAPIEIATGIVFGYAPRPLPRGAALRPAEALEMAVRPAVRSGRCFVSFSGGRDSSAVLAAATTVARREGLALPVPLTIRASEVAKSDESDWQESVVRHLDLADWVRLEVRDDLDAVGPYARRALVRHGLLWPFNAHFHAPMLELATGGTLLTGIGGDELWSAATVDPISTRRRLLQLAPGPVRRAALAQRVPIAFPWLRPGAVREARRAAAADSAAAPRTAVRRMARLRGMRYTAVGTAALDLLARDAGAAIAHPLLDARLWPALAAAAPRAGFSGVGAALALTAGHALPAELVSRRTKASFDAVFFNTHSHALAREWTGEGVPGDLVDIAALRRHWLGGKPDSHSLTLMQAAWLAAACREARAPAALTS